MYPLLDPWDKGSVTQDSFLFLELEPSKKRRLVQKVGQAQAKAPNSAMNLLSNLTKMGQRADMDKYLQPSPEELEALARQPGEKPRRRQRLASRRCASTPELPPA